MLCIHTASFFYHADNVGPSSPRSRHFCGDSERCKLKRKDKEELVDLLRQKYLLIKEYMKRVEKKKKVEDGEEREEPGRAEGETEQITSITRETERVPSTKTQAQYHRQRVAAK